MDFVTELIAKLEKSRVLARDRGKKRVRLKPRTTRSERTKKGRSMSPTARAKAYASRAAYDATIVGMYQHFGRACRAKQKYHLKKADELGQAGNEEAKASHLARADSWKLEMSLDDWVLTWLSCCDIMVVENEGVYARQVLVPAWKARGRDYRNCPQLKRIDSLKPWTKDNVQVVYKGKVISSG